MITLHAHAIEWIWLAVSFLSHVFSIRSLIDAVKDEAFLSAAGKNGARRLIADSNIRHEIFSMMMSLVATAAAVASLFLAPPPPTLQERPQMVVVIMASIIIAVIMASNSVLERHVRKKLAQYGDDEKPIDPVTGTETVKQVAPISAPTASHDLGTATDSLTKIKENTAAIDENTRRTDATVQDLKDKQ